MAKGFPNFQKSFQSIIKEDGVKGFDRGFPFAMLYNFHWIIFMQIYEQSNKLLGFSKALSQSNTSDKNSSITLKNIWMTCIPMVSSTLAKITSTGMAYPFLTIRTRI